MGNEPSDQTIQAWIALHRAHRLLLEKVEKALKNTVLPSLDWYDVLLELQREKATGLRQYEISDKVLLTKYNLSRLLDRLEKNGLVQRHTSMEDGRGNRVLITDAGSKTLKQMWPVYSQSIQAHFGEKLSASETERISAILGKVLQ